MSTTSIRPWMIFHKLCSDRMNDFVGNKEGFPDE